MLQTWYILDKDQFRQAGVDDACEVRQQSTPLVCGYLSLRIRLLLGKRLTWGTAAKELHLWSVAIVRLDTLGINPFDGLVYNWNPGEILLKGSYGIGT